MGVFFESGFETPLAEGCAIPIGDAKHQARTVPCCAGFSFATRVYKEFCTLEPIGVCHAVP